MSYEGKPPTSEERLEELEAKVAELERKWQQDHETLYILLHQRLDDLQQQIATHAGGIKHVGEPL